MKVGFDGVTLGAWVDVFGVKSILDVGCGSGLIALILAQRCGAKITAIDIDEDGAIQAQENVKQSPWSSRISVRHISLQTFAKNTDEKFNLIVSNPPFFTDSVKSVAPKRSIARHNDLLPQEELIRCANKLLAPEGKLCLILPINEGELFLQKAASQRLFCHRRVTLYPSIQKSPKRMLLEFSQTEQKACDTSHLIVEKERGTFTPEYTALVKDFYLKL